MYILLGINLRSHLRVASAARTFLTLPCAGGRQCDSHPDPM